MAESPNEETTVAEQAAALHEQNAPKTPEKKEKKSGKEATEKATPKKATTPKAATPKSHAKSPSTAGKATGLKRPAASGKAKAAAKVKPTTKVKKVPKSQAKAKSTPKAAPKAAGSNKSKQTGEQSEQQQKKEPQKKKGKETLKDQARKWVDNLDKPEDEEKENTTEAKAEERDRQKAQKFRKREKAGAWPAEVKEAFDAAEKSENPRANKTQLINSLFRKEGNNFVMVLKDPASKRVQKLLGVKYGKEEAQSYPWSIMLYDKFGGNQSALEKALQCGDVVVTSYQGKDYYSYNTLKSGRMKSLGDESELNDGQHTLDESSHQVISDWFKSLNVCSLQQQVEDSAEAAGDTVLVLTKPKTQEVDWNHVEKVLQSAKAAQEKLIRDGMKLKEQVLAAKDQDLLDTFKGSLKDLQDNDKDLDHCLLWKVCWFGVGELPGGKTWDVASGKDWMTTLAKQTQKANEKIEGVKTTLKDEHDSTAPAKRKRLGQRQRLALNPGQPEAKTTSELANFLVEEWAWGHISPQMAQQVASKACSDMQHAAPTPLQSLAKLGGGYANKMSAALIANQKSKLPQPFVVQLPYKKGNQMQKLLLPHELFASIYQHYYDTFQNVLVGPPGYLQEFWRTNKEHPCMSLHPALAECLGLFLGFITFTSNYKGKAIEIRSFGPVILSLWEKHYNSSVTMQKNILVLLKLNQKVDAMLEEHKGEFSFPDHVAQEFTRVIFNMGHLLVWCFSGEDYMHHVQQLAHSCLAGTGPFLTVNKVADKMRMALHVQFTKGAYWHDAIRCQFKLAEKSLGAPRAEV
ncbi:unnamed protein product [Cladocopium goreaui]|uniref:Uncharacterized protein n=1 Tax=Cladocopium goreaui TaxID=2562237 RepID=A0A9P1GD17_9DINO|nr:unnamed protein product [Cladocopium goreaui]